MTRSKPILAALFCLFIIIAGASSYNGDSLIATVQNGQWKAMTFQGGPMPPIMYSLNLLVDCDSSRIFLFGSELEASYSTTVYNNNCVYIWNLKNFTWRWTYPDDVTASYRRESSPLFGGDTSKFWAVCSTGHPVPTHMFDAAKYIPGKSCFLANVFPDHNATVANALNPGANATPGNCRGLIGEPSSWLFDTKTLRWTQLKNGLSPNPWQCPMGVTPDGETVIQLESNGNTWHFDWSDSTWELATVTGTKPSPANACLEYDTYLNKFICVGGSSYSLSTYDPVTHVWERLSTVCPASTMNGCHTGYDTLSKVLLVHAPYGTVTGYSMTLAWHSETAQWDTVRKVADGLGAIVPYEGYGFKGEFDLKRNVFYYLKVRDFWCFRYDGYDPSVATDQGQEVARKSGLTVSPNPFSPALTITPILENGRSAEISVFDIRGKKVAQFADVTRAVTWRPKALAPGLYLVEMRSGAFRATQRVFRDR